MIKHFRVESFQGRTQLFGKGDLVTKYRVIGPQGDSGRVFLSEQEAQEHADAWGEDYERELQHVPHDDEADA